MVTRKKHKVANVNIEPKQPFYPCLSPVAVPPPCQVEEQVPNTPPSRSKQSKRADKLKRRKLNRKQTKVLHNLTDSSSKLQRLERKLEEAAVALSAANAQANIQNTFEKESPATTSDVIDIPMPPSWSESKPTCASEEELKQMVLNGEVPTAIADSGASSSIGKPMIPTCSNHALNADPLVHTGRKSTKIFQYGGGSVAPVSEVKEFPFDVRGEAKEIHMVPGT